LIINKVKSIVSVNPEKINSKKFKFGAGITVFVLFFCVAVTEAVRTQKWLIVAFWLIIGGVFLFAVNFGKTNTND